MPKNKSFFMKLGVAAVVVSVFAVGAVLRILPPSESIREQTPGPADRAAVDLETVGQAPRIGPDGKIPLKVLYVGVADTPRFQSFNELLIRHFTQAASADLHAFREEQADGFDVVIFDEDGVNWKSMSLSLSSAYAKPTVTIGVPGAFWCDAHSLKNGYM